MVHARVSGTFNTLPHCKDTISVCFHLWDLFTQSNVQLHYLCWITYRRGETLRDGMRELQPSRLLHLLHCDNDKQVRSCRANLLFKPPVGAEERIEMLRLRLWGDLSVFLLQPKTLTWEAFPLGPTHVDRNIFTFSQSRRVKLIQGNRGKGLSLLYTWTIRVKNVSVSSKGPDHF